MNRRVMPRVETRAGERMSILLIALPLIFTAAPAARGDEESAKKILKAMSEYVASQTNLSLKYDTDIEVITPDVQKIQFSSSGEVLLSRPDKVRVTRTGGYRDVELVFDGKTVTVQDKDAKVVARLDAPGSVDKLVDRLRTEYLIEMPGADLLLSGVYDQLIEGVIDAKHIGLGVVDGVECEHLAFRNQDTDWQLWVEAGERPIPRKYVITSKAVAAAPQYTLRIKDWKTDAKADPSAFVFKPPEGAKTIAFDALTDIDEVPSALVAGGKK